MSLLPLCALKVVVAQTVNRGGKKISQISLKNIFICVLKMSESLKGLERVLLFDKIYQDYPGHSRKRDLI